MDSSMVLRGLAALLVANSHLESYYPIPQLAGDGLLGNSLFFLLSGFGLAKSAERSNRRFLEWFGRRLSRIYPALFLVVLLLDLVPNSGWVTWSLRDWVLNFGWGRKYAFVGQILTFYVLLYPLLKCRDRRVIPAILVLLFIPVPFLPWLGRSDVVFHSFHWVYLFQMMLFGVWLARRGEDSAPGGIRALAAVAGLSLVYVGARVGVISGRLADWFFLPHLFVFPMIYFLLRLSRAPWLVEGPLKNRWVALAVTITGASSLEIYLTHGLVIACPQIAALVFPLNVVVFLGASVAVAWLFSTVIVRIREFLAGLGSGRPGGPGVIAQAMLRMRTMQGS